MPETIPTDPLSTETEARLRHVSTATLTTQLFKRGFRNVFMQGVHRLTDTPVNMVGPAYTLRYIPAREDIDHLGVFQDPDHPQRKAVETCPPGAVLVMDCRGDASAASAGGILMTRMMVRGVGGVVTDGGLRDSGEIAGLRIPVFFGGPSAPTNLIKHHAVDLNVPIGCGGVPVYPGDVLVGDDDGVVVVPRELADEVAEEAAAQERMERFILSEIQAGKGLRGVYPPNDETRERYKTWKDEGE